MEKIVLSANFKKDYIAYSAVVIFFLIISLEIFMAIFIPAHLQIEGVWGKEVARQEMINEFDAMRKAFLVFKSRKEYAQDEAKVIGNGLIPLTKYLRLYQYEIGLKDIEDIEKTTRGYRKFLNHLKKDGAYSTDIKLTTKDFIKTLKKEMAKTK